MILITGATGKTGQAVIAALAARGSHKLRALVQPARQSSAASQQIATQAQIMIGDLLDVDSLAAACSGVQALYHICPNMHPQEVAIGRHVIAAARAARVPHFVYHSVLHPQVEMMPHHWNKLRVEEMLCAAQLAFTILQPCAYMQNLLTDWHAITGRGVHSVPYPPETRLSLIDLADLAAVAAKVLTEPGHFGATYELCGTPGLTQTQLAELLSRQLKQPVRIEVVSLNDWAAAASTRGLNDYALASLLAMFRYYALHGLSGSPNVLRWLLAREPTPLAAFVQRNTVAARRIAKPHSAP